MRSRLKLAARLADSCSIASTSFDRNLLYLNRTQARQIATVLAEYSPYMSDAYEFESVVAMLYAGFDELWAVGAIGLGGRLINAGDHLVASYPSRATVQQAANAAVITQRIADILRPQEQAA